MFFTPDKKFTSLALKVQALAVTVCQQLIPAIPVAEAH